MDKLDRVIRAKRKISPVWYPVIFNLRNRRDRKLFAGLLGRKEAQWIVDDYEEELRELFAIEHPSEANRESFESQFAVHLASLKKRRALAYYGKWVYYPWLSTLAHVLDDRDFQTVRTARNRYLISPEEQEKFYTATVGIGGLSVGSSVALAIVIQGGGRRIRLADHDRLALSNMNRIRASVGNLGLPKVELAARQIYEINPYAAVEIFPEGLTDKNMAKFFNGPPKLDIVIDELDNLAVKYLIREQARKRGIAVVMGADNGDNAVVDIERYDLNRHTPFFHGRMGKVSYETLKSLNKFGIGKMITKHVGPENVTERMQKSLLEIGKTVVSWPQLGGAAMLNGAAIAYCVRRILNGQPLERNRALVSLDEKFVPAYNTPVQKKKRLKIANSFKKIFGL